MGPQKFVRRAGLAKEKKKEKKKTKDTVSKKFKDKTKGRSGKKAVSKIPKGAKIVTRVGGSNDEIKASMRSGSDRYVRLKDGDTITLAFLQDPKEWLRFEQHNLNSGGNNFQSVPCIGPDKCLLCQKGENKSGRAAINVFDYKSKKVKLLFATGEVISDLLSKADRRKTLKDRKYTMTREGENRDTKYHFDREDEKPTEGLKKSVRLLLKDAELLDPMEDLEQQLNKYYGDNEDDDDEDEEYDDELDDDDDEDDDDDDDEDEDDDDDDDDSDDDDDDDDDEDDDEDDDDEDDEDDDDEDDDEDEPEEVLPKKSKGKVKKKKGKK